MLSFYHFGVPDQVLTVLKGKILKLLLIKKF